MHPRGDQTGPAALETPTAKALGKNLLRTGNCVAVYPWPSRLPSRVERAEVTGPVAVVSETTTQKVSVGDFRWDSTRILPVVSNPVY